MSDPKTQVRLVMRQGAHVGKRYSLKKASIDIGADSACNIVVRGDFVSPQHARISRRDDGLWMISNQSINRTLVNQQVVDTRQLAAGDMIQIGAETLFEFEVVEKKTRKEKKKSSAEKQTSLTKRPLVQIGIGIYLLVLVAAGIYFKGFSADTDDLTLSPEQVAAILDESRAFFVGEKFAAIAKQMKVTGAAGDASEASAYFQLITSVKPGQSTQSAEVDRLIEELLARSRDHMFNAWRYERQRRWAEAIAEYRQVLFITPDIRVPLVIAVSKRISMLTEKIE